jgi:hypothetical protein
LPRRAPNAIARLSVRCGVEAFLQGVLDHPANAPRWRQLSPAGWQALPADLWREGILLAYRLLFVIRAEASAAFPSAAATWWRESYSPSQALAGMAGQVLAGGNAPLEERLRRLCSGLQDGFPEGAWPLPSSRLFRRGETPLLDACAWGDDGCGRLLETLLRSPTGRRDRHAEPHVASFGLVSESVLDLEPGLATEPMVRLRWREVERVVPASRVAECGIAAKGAAVPRSNGPRRSGRSLVRRGGSTSVRASAACGAWSGSTNWRRSG